MKKVNFLGHESPAQCEQTAKTRLHKTSASHAEGFKKQWVEPDIWQQCDSYIFIIVRHLMHFSDNPVDLLILAKTMQIFLNTQTNTESIYQ